MQSDLSGLYSPCSVYPTQMGAADHAALVQAAEEHAPVVRPVLGPDYRVHYIRPDGSEVPGFEYFLAKELGR